MAHTSTIKVKEIINSSAAVTPSAGELLYEKILSNLKQHVETYIDFENIGYLTSAFLNAAIGQLYKSYSREDLNHYLHVLNLSDNDLKIFKKVTNRARHFFNNEESTRNNFKDIIDE
jgi:hypothetical protein